MNERYKSSRAFVEKHNGKRVKIITGYGDADGVVGIISGTCINSCCVKVIAGDRNAYETAYTNLQLLKDEPVKIDPLPLPE